MANAGNFFRQTITDLSASSRKEVTELNDEFRFRNDGKPCNFLHFVNKGNNPVTLELNGESEERFHVEGNGGTFIINKDDQILYSSLGVIEEDGNAVTGKLKITGAVL
jgi:hypothetical protein